MQTILNTTLQDITLQINKRWSLRVQIPKMLYAHMFYINVMFFCDFANMSEYLPIKSRLQGVDWILGSRFKSHHTQLQDVSTPKY